nr:MAG TPA: hypothetical protein [Caudoviricetes sp.]
MVYTHILQLLNILQCLTMRDNFIRSLSSCTSKKHLQPFATSSRCFQFHSHT